MTLLINCVMQNPTAALRGSYYNSGLDLGHLQLRRDPDPRKSEPWIFDPTA